MTLATHAIVGGAVAKAFSGHPVLGIFLAFCSHFVLDAIPHWGYHLKSYDCNKKDFSKSVLHLNKDFLKDLIILGSDGFLGLIFSLIFFHSFWGAIFGMLPDFIQFLYLTLRREPFISFQKLHSSVHTRKESEVFNFSNIFSQVAVIALAIIFFGVK